jgi:spermidine synthase
VQGLHLTADLYDCACATTLLSDSVALKSACVSFAANAGLTVVGAHFHTFADAGGVTGLVLLAESHLAIHTWPELNAVTLDVYVCNFRADNSDKAQTLTDALVTLFCPKHVNRNSLLRGAPAARPDALALEWLTPEIAHGFTTRRPPISVQSAYQRIEWHHTQAMGRMLALDGAFMLSERDEFIYHECMVHVPALAHADPKRALVMGGGDGCSARELLKHSGIQTIVIAELDPMVIATCRTHFSDVNGQAFDDPRVRVEIGDALAFLRNSSTRFDIIVMDLTDPDDAESTPLYSTETYELIADRLSPDGMLSLHIGSAFFHPERFASTLRDLRTVFTEVHAYKAFMPTYGAEWGMACASMHTNPRALSEAEIEQRLKQRAVSDLRFYTPRVHTSLFAWPAYADRLLGSR